MTWLPYGQYLLKKFSGTPIDQPISLARRKPYTMGNVDILAGVAEMAGYPTGVWATERDWKELGFCVKDGERPTEIYWSGHWTRRPKDDEEEEERPAKAHKAYGVFNAAQVEAEPREVPAK